MLLLGIVPEYFNVVEKVKCKEYSGVLRFWQDLGADGMIHQCVNFLF